MLEDLLKRYMVMSEDKKKSTLLKKDTKKVLLFSYIHLVPRVLFLLYTSANALECNKIRNIYCICKYVGTGFL